MDPLSRNISSLERELQISQVNPLKIIGGLILIGIVIVVCGILWFRPTSLLEDGQDKISWERMGQFILAVGIGMLSILWILWNLFWF